MGLVLGNLVGGTSMKGGKAVAEVTRPWVSTSTSIVTTSESVTSGDRIADQFIR
jgi:hypothetical protein